MEPLPLPPPPVAPQRVRPVARPGQLTTAWRATFIIGWAGVVLGLAAVVKSSRTLGLSTWWLGPESDPAFVGVIVLPFLIPLVTIILGFRNCRYLPVVGIVAALGLGAIAAGDLGRFEALAQVELATAGIGLLVSLAAFAGMLRRAGHVEAGGSALAPAPSAIHPPLPPGATALPPPDGPATVAPPPVEPPPSAPAITAAD